MRSVLHILGFFAVLLGFNQASQAGVVIIDGRTQVVASQAQTFSKSTYQPTNISQPTTTRPMSPTEQQIYIYAASILNSHDAALEEAAEAGALDGLLNGGYDHEDGEEEDEGCAAAPAGAAYLLFSAVYLLRRRVAKKSVG